MFPVLEKVNKEKERALNAFWAAFSNGAKLKEMLFSFE